MSTIIREERIGGQRLILGDCLAVIGGIEADSLVTDPPYGMAYKSGYATDTLWGSRRDIAGDETTFARDAVVAWSGCRPALVFGTWKVPRPASARQVLIWDKGGALGMGALDIPWKPDHEEIYVIGRGFIGTRDCGSVIRCPPVQSMAKNGRVHPTEKPVRLMQELVRKVPGIVLDPFMGSGTTLVACQRMGRNGIGIECDPGHFETACRRVEDATRQPDLFVAPAETPKQEVLL